MENPGQFWVEINTMSQKTFTAQLGAFRDKTVEQMRAVLSASVQDVLDEAQKLFKEKKVDTLSVSENGKQLGMLDIQDLMKAIAG